MPQAPRFLYPASTARGVAILAALLGEPPLRTCRPRFPFMLCLGPLREDRYLTLRQSLVPSMNSATYSLIESTGLWQVTRNGSLLAGFVERQIAESFLIREVDVECIDGRACRVLVRAIDGARYEWRYGGAGTLGAAKQLH